MTRDRILAAIVRDLSARTPGEYLYQTREEIPDGLLREVAILLAREGISARVKRAGARLVRVCLAPVLA